MEEFSQFLYNNTFKNIKDVQIKMSNDSGKDIGDLIKNSEKFLYILSPYISGSLVEKLIKEKYLKNNLENKNEYLIAKNEGIDIRFIFNIKNEDLKKTDKSILNTINLLYYYEETQKYEEKKNQYLSKNVGTTRLLKFFFIFASILFSLFILLLVALILGINFFKDNEIIARALIFLKTDYPKRYLIVAGNFLILFFIWIFIFFKFCNISSKEEIEIEKLKKENLPDVLLLPNLNVLYLKYEREPFFYPKIYVSEKQVILSSANFTYNGLNRNIETLVIINDEEVIDKIKNYCLGIFANNKSFKNSISEKEMIEILYKNSYLFHREDYKNKGVK